MPRKATIGHKGYQGVGGDPDRRNVRPDTGARKSAKKVRDLEAMAKRSAPVRSGSGAMAVVAFYLVGGIPAALLGVVAAYVNTRVFRRLEPPRRRYTLAGVVVLVTAGVAELLRVVVTGALAMTLMLLLF